MTTSLSARLRLKNSPFFFFYHATPKRSGKKSSPQTTDNRLLTQFCLEHNLPESLMAVLAERYITSESVLTEVTEQDFTDVKLV